MTPDFMDVLVRDDLTVIRAAAKTDLHSHALLSTRLENLERWIGSPLKDPPAKMDGLDGMHAYIAEVLVPHVISEAGFRFVPLSGIEDAIADGVVVLEMSFDIRLAQLYPGGLGEFLTHIEGLVAHVRSRIDFRPELGIAREHTADSGLMKLAAEAIESGVFRSVDLYSHETACLPETLQPLYVKARTAGMKLKAHVGEFGGAESVRRTVEILDLDAVQHGIGAAASTEVMQWLSENQIPLNVCPTSNVMLDAAPDLAAHPIRVLFDNGVPVTINTDDLMIFGQSVSEEYRNLYRAGVFSAEELETIRRISLEMTT